MSEIKGVRVKDRHSDRRGTVVGWGTDKLEGQLIVTWDSGDVARGAYNPHDLITFGAVPEPGAVPEALRAAMPDTTGGAFAALQSLGL